MVKILLFCALRNMKTHENQTHKTAVYIILSSNVKINQQGQLKCLIFRRFEYLCKIGIYLFRYGYFFRRKFTAESILLCFSFFDCDFSRCLLKYPYNYVTNRNPVGIRNCISATVSSTKEIVPHRQSHWNDPGRHLE